MEHIETNEIHNYAIDLNNWSNKKHTKNFRNQIFKLLNYKYLLTEKKSES